jgi:glycosyltransferase involved in cell wall biosynthesis
MKVLFVTTSYPADELDSRGIHVHRLARSLLTEGIEVRVVAPAIRGRSVPKLDGVVIDRRRYWFRRGRLVAEGLGGIVPNVKRRPWLVAQLPTLAGALARGVRANRDWADVIHAHWLYPGGLVATATAKGTPTIVTTHGGDLNRAGSRGLTAWMIGRVLRRAQRVVAVSEALLRRLLEMGANPNRTSFQPLGVDIANGTDAQLADWVEPAGVLKILFVGSLIPRKAPLVLVDAVARLRDKGTTAAVVFAGTGALAAEIERLAAGHGLAVRLLGNVPPNEVRSWLATTDVMVLPSLSEGRPVAIMEAMASGVPVIATDIAGVRELVTTDTGFLVEPDSPAELSHALLQLAGNSNLRERLGEEGRNRIAVLGLTTQAVAKSHRRLYEDVTAESRQ